MHAISFIIACLATAAMAAPAPAPVRDQLSAPRVNPRAEEANTNEKYAEATFDNGYVPKMPW